MLLNRNQFVARRNCAVTAYRSIDSKYLTSLCNIKIGRVRRFARLDYFARVMVCDTNIYSLSRLSVVFIPVLRNVALTKTFCIEMK